MRLLLLSTGGGGGNILRSVKALFDRDLAVTEKADSGYAARLRDAVTTRFLDTNEFSLTDVPPEERLLIGARTTGRLGARHNPDVAREALEESRSEVEALLKQHADRHPDRHGRQRNRRGHDVPAGRSSRGSIASWCCPSSFDHRSSATKSTSAATITR